MQPDRKTNRHYIGKHSSHKMFPQPLTDWHVRVKLATRARAQFCCVALAWELPQWHLSLVRMRCNGREPKQMRTPFGHCISAFALLFLSTSSFLKFGFSFVFGSFFTFTGTFCSFFISTCGSSESRFLIASEPSSLQHFVDFFWKFCSTSSEGSFFTTPSAGLLLGFAFFL